MEPIIRENISAIFALIGVIAGGLLSFLGTWLLKKRELKLRLWEKVLDRRIEAHEQIAQLSKSLCTMRSLGKPEESGELARAPAFMFSKGHFEEWYKYYSQTVGGNSTWLSTELTRELSLLQDYIVNLYEFLRPIDPNLYPEIGALIRNDFIDFSTRIEKLAFEFFRDDLFKLRLNDLNKWHKYPIEETQRRLSSMRLFSKNKQIEALIKGNEHES
ncbi:MAG: hypothetical protein QOD32_611 [Pyrinomonadaceae bacterium]|jgi:hypothetical protein|nr:hypothetical protein [Pyrinomonadaceae bacterium]